MTTNGRTAVAVTSNVTMMDGEVAAEAGPLLQLDLTMSLSCHRGECVYCLGTAAAGRAAADRYKAVSVSPAVLHAAGWAGSGLPHLNTVITSSTCRQVSQYEEIL